MKKLFLITVFLCTVTGSLLAKAPCADSANIYTFTYNGHKYELVKERMAWTEAAACAVSRGGYLAEINDSLEQVAVYNAIKASGVSSNYFPVMDGGGASYIWLGATDAKTEGQWLWDGKGNNTGAAFWSGQGAAGTGGGAAVAGSFVNWGGKSNGTLQEPDDYANMQDGAALALSAWPYGMAGEWNDINTSNSIYYLIEYASATGLQNSLPEPPTIKVFPVPAQDYLCLENHSATAELTYELYAADGKLITSGSMQQKAEIQTSALAGGIYYICLPQFPSVKMKVPVSRN